MYYNYVSFNNPNPNGRNAHAQTPLHITVKLGDGVLTKKLLQKGAEVNVIDVFGNTPLSLACIEKPNINIVRLLLHYHADINLRRPDHLDHVFLECIFNCTSETHMQIINLLIKNGVNINTTHAVNNRNCMHIVAMTGNALLAELLLEEGAILNIKDNFNYTPIELANCREHFEVLNVFSRYSL